MYVRSSLLFLFFFLFINASYAQVVTKPTQVGINTANPAEDVSLHIVDNFEAIRLDGSAPFISWYNGAQYRGYLYMTGNNMYLFNRMAGNLYFGTNDGTKMLLDTDGNLGVGTIFPQQRLHVRDGLLSGGLFNANTIAGFEKGVGNAFISILTDDANESGLLFGDQLESAQGAIIYNNGSTPDGLQFRTNGNLTRMTIDNVGDVGIGKFNPRRPLHIKSRNGGDEYGLLIERSGSTTTWEVSVFGGNLAFFYDGAQNPVSAILTDGTYTTSDRRLKKNIQAYKPVLPLLDRLQVVTYDMIDKGTKEGSSLGLIAQDVVRVFPEIVRLAPNRGGEQFYSMDYSKIGVIALKAIQEMQRQLEEKSAANEELEAEIKALRSENNVLQSRLAAVESAIAELQQNCCTAVRSISLDPDVVPSKEQPILEQNQPNPFAGNTRIGYFVPSEVEHAVLRVSTLDGQLIRQIRIDERGQGALIIDTQQLTSGTYIYTLLIDGEVYESKKMVLER